jgi:hypothetical protein
MGERKRPLTTTGVITQSSSQTQHTITEKLYSYSSLFVAGTPTYQYGGPGFKSWSADVT